MTMKSSPSSSSKTKSPSERKSKPPAVKAGTTADKAKKPRLVRDSFTMPEAEYAEIANIKKRCLARGMAVKKSEILRAAILTLAALRDAPLTQAIRRLQPIKAGRPAKNKK